MENTRLIELKNVTKLYDGEPALNDVSLYIRDGEFLTLLGPSGCGKTTMLRIIAGFTMPTEGKLLMYGKDMVGIPPHRRKVNTVFQKYALFPHLNVFDNIAFGLKIKKLAKKEIELKVNAMLDLVNLSGYGKRYIEQLSGGQQQRVAIARALVNEPEVLLLDEPTRGIDVGAKYEIYQLIIDLANEGKGVIMVSSEMPELLGVCDRILVMSGGQLAGEVDAKNTSQEEILTLAAKYV